MLAMNGIALRRLDLRFATLGAVLVGIAVLILVLPSSAALVNENLLTTAPSGYQVGFHDKNSNSEITEWVPEGETVENWTEMVTVLIFFNASPRPEVYMHNIETYWRENCPEAEDAREIASVVENGYPSLVFLLNCPRNPKTGKLEITWFKAVQGNDSLYVVQKAFKFAPSKEQIGRWMGFLKAVRVCDTRLAERACPKTQD
jgi:hypothetical protein